MTDKEKIKNLADKIEDFVYQITPDIESLEAVMVELSNELKERYTKDILDSMAY
jgi:hypothetical protein